MGKHAVVLEVYGLEILIFIQLCIIAAKKTAGEAGTTVSLLYRYTLDTGGANEADKSSSLNGDGSKRVSGKKPPKGLFLKTLRNKFFPYWRSVLSARLQVNIVPPPFEASSKGIQSSEARMKSIEGTKANKKAMQVTSKQKLNLILMSGPHSVSKYECRRQLCSVASTSLKVLRRA